MINSDRTRDHSRRAVHVNVCLVGSGSVFGKIFTVNAANFYVFYFQARKHGIYTTSHSIDREVYCMTPRCYCKHPRHVGVS